MVLLFYLLCINEKYNTQYITQTDFVIIRNGNKLQCDRLELNVNYQVDIARKQTSNKKDLNNFLQRFRRTVTGGPLKHSS